jgi:hypothetical protein
MGGLNAGVLQEFPFELFRSTMGHAPELCSSEETGHFASVSRGVYIGRGRDCLGPAHGLFVSDGASFNRAKSQGVADQLCVQSKERSVRIFAVDHDENFPQEVSTHLGGCRELTNASSSIVSYFLSLSNELATPKTVMCPVDTRKQVTNFGTLRRENISYFASWSAQSKLTNAILTGDRNISRRSGWVLMRQGTNLPSEPFLHGGTGNVVLTDGSVYARGYERDFAERMCEAVGITNRILVP